SSRLARIANGILPEKTGELGEQFWMPGAKGARTLEKCLGCDGEELDRICRAVAIQHGGRPSSVSITQCFELPAHYPCPRQILSPRRQRWRTVAGIIFEVELVSELVQNKIRSVRWIGRTPFHIIPGEHERSQPAPSLTEPIFTAFLQNVTRKEPRFIGSVTRGIDKNRGQLGVVVCLTMKQEKTGLRGNREADFIG